MGLSKNTGLGGLVEYVIGIIDQIIPVLTLLVLLFLLYAAFRYVVKAQEAKGKNPEREAIIWGLISLFVIVSVWGILRAMCTTVIGNSSCREGANSTGVDYQFGTYEYQNPNQFGGPR